MNQRITLLTTLILVSLIGFSQKGTEGYYKDVFMNGGVELYSYTSLDPIYSLSYSMKYLAIENQQIQDNKLSGNLGETWC